MFKTYKVGIIWTVLLMTVYSGRAQKLNPTYQKYIITYASEAVSQMKANQIPASITLAQGLVETGAGTSTLASIHNNHFGIKCHRTWAGKKTYRDDDARGECFRSYSSAKESFDDHSDFLKRPRYRSLFQLDITDYRGWAIGLQRCGYATNKGYANLLINMIEIYELYTFDRGATPSWYKGNLNFGSNQKNNSHKRGKGVHPKMRQAYLCYGLLYIIAKDGDTFDSIGEEFDISPKKLAKWNDAPRDFPIRKDMIIYLQKKNSKAEPPYFTYVVQVGDSMHSIAQKFGMRMKNLYSLNDKDGDYVPEEGDILKLR
ncbi:MAG: glucosaminidase domain-containing protein [Porphyromonadaceae bacterium]|nr:glucosaminidase domain-containing protein [Porphyromonadaceae bacterium]